MQPETRVKIAYLNELRKLPRSWWFKTQMVALLGIPDIIGCLNGRFVAIELKKDEKEKPTALQVQVLNYIAKAGGSTFVGHPKNMGGILDVLRTF